MVRAFHPGQRVWVPDEEDAWVKATVLQVNGSKLQVKVENHSEDVVEFESSLTEDINEASVDEYLIEDLTKLPDLHQPAILETLHSRFKRDIIYTYTGLILIAINPFKNIPGNYGKNKMTEFINLDQGDKYPPHAYSTAHLTFLNMINNNGQNQSVLVSGESGAGKTVTTKLVMDYLTAVSQARSGHNDDSSKRVCQRVLSTNPLLESLGNAATLRNDNSSRFGKLIHLQFQPGHSTLIGAKIDTYLLEKARITSQQEGERNFHIFYELAAGLTSQQKKDWHMPDLEDCNYTNQSDRFNRNDVDDAQQFVVTLSAMQSIGITEEEKDRICKTVIAVLHLGNIEFEETFENSEEGSRVSENSREAARSCCTLLDVNMSILERALCSRSIIVGVLASTKVEKPLTREQAIESRDALASALYERLFLWVVWKVNQNLSVVRNSAQKRLSQDLQKLGQKFKGKLGGNYHNDYSISCLDIFGFEVFRRNGFEQMCINYANEVLQSIFNEFVFSIEQKYYEQEGIDWRKIEFPDNHACIEMIEGKPIGLLRLIDEECLYPKGNDKSLHMKLVSNMKKYNTFAVDVATQMDHNLFSIRHFAGDVEYDVHGFHAKNKNELRQEAVDLIRSSQDELIKILLPATAEEASGANSVDNYFDKVFNTGKNKNKRKMRSSMERNRRNGTAKIQQRTVSSHFKDQLGEAMSHIRASKPHFVRCVKPNDMNVSDILDRPRTLEQLNYSGVLEAVRIARAGYTSRFQLKEFLSRFQCLRKGGKRGSDKSECLAILQDADLKKYDDYQVGHTRVFLRADAFSKLESLKRETLHDSVCLIQKNVRTWLFRKHINDRIRERQEAERRRREEEEQARLERERLEYEAELKRQGKEVPPPAVKPKERKRDYRKTRMIEENSSFGTARSSEFNEERERQAEVDLTEPDDLIAALQPLILLAKAKLEPLLQGRDLKDIDPEALFIAGPILALLLLLIISPALFLNVVILGGIGFAAALQFRAQKLKEQRKRGKGRNARRKPRRQRHKPQVVYSHAIKTVKLDDSLWETASMDSYETQGTSRTSKTKYSKKSRGIKQSQKKLATLPRPKSMRLGADMKQSLKKPLSHQSLKKPGAHRSLRKTGSSRSLKRTASGKFAPVK